MPAKLNPGDTPTFADIKTIAMASDTLEDTLQEVARLYPKYLHFHLLVYDSKSLHETTHKEPRVIIFGHEAKFIMTYNGQYSMRAGNAFETVEFNEAEKKFELREIEFKTKASPPSEHPLEAGEIDFENEKLRISKSNPGKCLMCHGPQAMPIFENYSLWPGFYGSDDDRLFGKA